MTLTKIQKTKLLRLKYAIKVLFTPYCWMRNYKTDKAVDQHIWDGLEKGDVGAISEHRMIIGGKVIWIENAPYANGKLGDTGKACGRITALFLRDSLREYQELQMIKTGKNYRNVMIMSDGVVTDFTRL